MPAKKSAPKSPKKAARKPSSKKNPETVSAYGNRWSRVVGASEEDLNAAEAALGIRMGDELRALFRTCAGGYPENSYYYNDQYDREVGVGWIMPLTDIPKHRGLIWQCEIQRKVHELPRELIPFAMDTGNSDIFCVNTVTNEVVYWVHDTAHERGSAVAANLTEFLTNLTEPPY
jgi:hypothetical protein